MSWSKRYPLCVFVWLAMAGTPVIAQTAVIGKVLVSKGDVMVHHADGSKHALVRRNDLLEGDRIVTANNSMTQLRLLDDTRISLGPDTQLAFDNFRYDDGPLADDIVFSVLTGTLRTIAGTAANDNRNTYRLDTPHASIIPTGATYSLVVEANELYAEVVAGSLIINNEVGNVKTDADSGNRYSRAANGKMPELLAIRPLQFETVR